MGVFTTRRIFVADPMLISAIAQDVALQFQNEGYAVENCKLLGGNADISITKGSMFKAIAGLKTALKLTLRQGNGQIQAEAGVGIFGQQAIPVMISMLVFWPAVVVQIWGMIQQSHIDDHAMALIEQSIQRLSSNPTVAKQGGGNQAGTSSGSFCSECGAATGSGKFCAGCGTKLG